MEINGLLQEAGRDWFEGPLGVLVSSHLKKGGNKVETFLNTQKTETKGFLNGF